MVLDAGVVAHTGVGRGPGTGIDDVGGEVGAADLQDLALVHEFPQSAQGLRVGGVGVGRVDLVVVDAVGAQPPQAGFHAPADPGRIATPLTLRQELGVAELAGNKHLFTAPSQRRAQELLRLATTVDVGGVEIVDPGIEGCVHHRPRGVGIDRHTEVVAPHPDSRHRQDSNVPHLHAVDPICGSSEIGV